MGAMDLGENRVLSALSIHEDPSDSEGEDSDAEDDLDGFDSEEGEEDEEEIIDVAPNLFERSNINIVNGDELVIENTCSEESCIRSFDSQRDQIEHSKYCPASTTHFAVDRDDLYSNWAMSIHNLLEHESQSALCPFLSCNFASQALTHAGRKASFLRHVSVRHGLVVSSLKSFQQFHLEEVESVQQMVDPMVTYLDLCHTTDEYVPINSLLQLPPEISRDDAPTWIKDHLAEYSRKFYQLNIHSISRRYDSIYNYNLEKLRRMDYCGVLRYPKAQRCVGATPYLACPFRRIISLKNSVVEKAVRSNEHGLKLPDMQLLPLALARGSEFDIRTPADAAEFLADPERVYAKITPEEYQFLADFRGLKDIYFTDTESVGPLLIQAAVVDAHRNVVFASHINHGCNTVEEIWSLAADLCGGKLSKHQAKGLRRAFGSPSLKTPIGCDVAWLADHWRQLKQSAPSMKVAEWSTWSCDQIAYRNALSRAGFDHEEILPTQSHWVLPPTPQNEVFSTL
ncbi:uncharacterized protein G6M90_00g056170 [Metarhizium brunneum]|uniref:Uncharacterized protein n=1 Tax=Metarhizium brunneum TaxID=500148 RepID=A0A7D5UWW0_9HYPO